MKTFTINNDQIKKAEKWQKIHKRKCRYKDFEATTGERWAYEFIPTGLGSIEIIKCFHCKEELNLTEYSFW